MNMKNPLFPEALRTAIRRLETDHGRADLALVLAQVERALIENRQPNVSQLKQTITDSYFVHAEIFMLVVAALIADAIELSRVHAMLDMYDHEDRVRINQAAVCLGYCVETPAAHPRPDRGPDGAYDRTYYFHKDVQGAVFEAMHHHMTKPKSTFYEVFSDGTLRSDGSAKRCDPLLWDDPVRGEGVPDIEIITNYSAPYEPEL